MAPPLSQAVGVLSLVCGVCLVGVVVQRRAAGWGSSAGASGVVGPGLPPPPPPPRLRPEWRRPGAGPALRGRAALLRSIRAALRAPQEQADMQAPHRAIVCPNGTAIPGVASTACTELNGAAARMARVRALLARDNDSGLPGAARPPPPGARAVHPAVLGTADAVAGKGGGRAADDYSGLRAFTARGWDVDTAYTVLPSRGCSAIHKERIHPGGFGASLMRLLWKYEQTWFNETRDLVYDPTTWAYR